MEPYPKTMSEPPGKGPVPVKVLANGDRIPTLKVPESFIPIDH